jgi:hypothetical protein
MTIGVLASVGLEARDRSHARDGAELGALPARASGERSDERPGEADIGRGAWPEAIAVWVAEREAQGAGAESGGAARVARGCPGTSSLPRLAGC